MGSHREGAAILQESPTKKKIGGQTSPGGRGRLGVELEGHATGGVLVDGARQVDSGEWYGILAAVGGEVMHLTIFEPIVCSTYSVAAFEVKKGHGLGRGPYSRRIGGRRGKQPIARVKVAVIPVVAIPVPEAAVEESSVEETVPEDERLAEVPVMAMAAEEAERAEGSVPSKSVTPCTGVETDATRVFPSTGAASAEMTSAVPAATSAVLGQYAGRQRQTQRSDQDGAKAIGEECFHGSPLTRLNADERRIHSHRGREP
jgi:hypothetical protein